MVFGVADGVKVFDFQCVGPTFEGWFASEHDFQQQHAKAMVQCPLCGTADIVKKLSAPRLSLSGAQAPTTSTSQASTPASLDVATTAPADTSLAAAWMAVARHVMANTTDVGSRFAEEARKMHYGEAQERSIRGKTTPDEAMALLDEGIEVMPFLLPEAVKGTLQ
jgi:hypothetical protein